MKERRDEQEARELLMAEVSIYTDDCGEIQFHCLNDCLGGGAWLNIVFYYFSETIYNNTCNIGLIYFELL